MVDGKCEDLECGTGNFLEGDIELIGTYESELYSMLGNENLYITKK